MTSLRRETDALKLASVRAGLLELSQAWGSLGRKCTLLAEAQTVSLTAPREEPLAFTVHLLLYYLKERVHVHVHDV